MCIKFSGIKSVGCVGSGYGQITHCCCACRYTEVRRRISDKYAEIENQLINEFIDAQMTLDTKRMKMYARALIPFSYVSH